MSAIRINDRKFRLLCIPVMSLLVTICFNLFYTLELGVPLWKVLLSNLVFVTATVETTRMLVLWANKLFGAATQTVRRILFIVAGLILLAPLIGASHIHFEKDILFQTSENESIYNYLSASGSSLFFCLIIATAYEAAHFFMRWNKAAQERETFEKAGMAAQYELLKNQVQPHFLFNSLNTAISLVDEDRTRAKKFIRQLSFVYRYLLQSNRQALVSLQEELNFTKAYQYLLQTRFEAGLQVHIEVDDDALLQLLPPLTLQILMENAVNHNIADTENPLHLWISTKEQQLLVQNNLQPKKAPVHSTRLGLSNIAAKYAALHLQQRLVIEEGDGKFSVALPLIAPSTETANTMANLQNQTT